MLNSLKKISCFFCFSLILALTSFFSIPQAFSQIGSPPPAGPPSNFTPMAMPENESFMGYAIEANGNFELCNTMVILDPAALLSKNKTRVPEGMLFIGSRRLMLTNLKIEKNSSYNYDPYKAEGIKPKIKAFKAKLVAEIIEDDEMPPVPGKTAMPAEQPGPNEADKNEIDVKIFEKYIEGGQKIPVLHGTAKYNGAKYSLYLNFMPPPPPGEIPNGAPATAPQPEKK